MTTRIIILIGVTAFLIGTAAAQEGGDQPQEPTGIIFNEPVAWNDPEPWGGNPPPWFEDPGTVDCGGRDACEASLENQTVPA